MSVLFCHDHRFVVGDGRVYSRGAMTAETFAPYREMFGGLKVAARTQPIRAGEDVTRLGIAFATEENLVALPSLSNIASLIRPNPAAIGRLRSAIAAADIVIARLPSEIGLAALAEARRMGRPAIVEVVGNPFDALVSHGAPGSRLYAPIAEWRMRRAVSRADFVHYVSGSFLQRRYPSAGLSVGVSDVRIPPPEPATLERRLASIAEDRPIVFGMVAALGIRQKRVDVAIRALARARKQDAGLTLRILGPGDPGPWQAVAAANGVADAVEFCGALPSGDAVLGWLERIDVYVQASFQEGLPRALIEAMRQATPALASAVGGTGELIAGEFLHRPGDAARLAEQMLMVRDSALRAKMARTNFAASLPYSLDAVTQRREAFWRSVLEHADLKRRTEEPSQ